MVLIMRFTRILLLLSAVTCFSFVGCASSEKKSDRDKVSQVPWNRPAQWEGKGVLGGMVQ